jgi:hypothetical protein
MMVCAATGRDHHSSTLVGAIRSRPVYQKQNSTNARAARD